MNNKNPLEHDNWRYQQAQILQLREAMQKATEKCKSIEDKIDQVAKLIERTEKSFNANASLDDDPNIEHSILSDIFFSWKEIYEKKPT